MKTILITNYVTVHRDMQEKFIEVKWQGSVPLKDCQVAFSAVKKGMEKGYSLILNNSDLESFTEDCRAWLKKEFIREEMSDISLAINRVAVIDPVSNVKIFLSALHRLAAVLYPAVLIKSFARLEEAQNWIHQEHLKDLLKQEHDLLNDESFYDDPVFQWVIDSFNKLKNDTFQKLSA